jgi:type IV secretion system protein VirD4
MAPLVAMFADFMFRKAQRISQGAPGGRLWLVLDEAPNDAAIPDMASALSDSGGRGIRIIGLSQSFAENRQRWGAEAATAIRDTSSIRLFLPGLEELDELDKIARRRNHPAPTGLDLPKQERVLTHHQRGRTPRDPRPRDPAAARGGSFHT